MVLQAGGLNQVHFTGFTWYASFKISEKTTTELCGVINRPRLFFALYLHVPSKVYN